MDAGDQDLRLRLDGTITGHVRAHSGLIHATDADASKVTVTASMMLSGQDVYVWRDEPFAVVFGPPVSSPGGTGLLDVTYRCGGDFLEYETPISDVLVRWTRASAP